jgi:hypothetical protein
MPSAQKKVIIRTFADVLSWGYLPQTLFVRENQVPLMATDGRLTTISMNDIKTISYVRDFNLDDPANPERLLRRTFPARPRGDGLWLRLTFLDNDILEGLGTLDIASLDSLLADRGLLLTPPDTRGNTQRLFVPRSALRSLEVLGFVTAPSRRLAKPASTPNPQPHLFPPPFPALPDE